MRIVLTLAVAGVLPACGNLNDDIVVIPFTFRTSVSTAGVEGDQQSGEARISGNGQYVVFSSTARTLAGVDTFGVKHVYRHNLATGATVLVSADDLGDPADDESSHPAISDDGRYVVFESFATTLTGIDPGGFVQIYVRDMDATVGNGISMISLVQTPSPDTPGDGDSANAVISGDGTYVAFESLATNFGDTHANGKLKIYRRNRTSSQLIPVSVTPAQGDPAASATGSVTPSISFDGSVIAFASDSADLMGPGGDTNGKIDVFVATISGVTSTIVLASQADGGGPTDNDSQNPSLSGDGNFVAFDSIATNILAVDGNGGFTDVFLVNLGTGAVTLIDQNTSGAQAEVNSVSQHPSVSFDGRFVAFESVASNLATGDTNLANDIFLRDVTAGTTFRVSVDSSGNPAGISQNSKLPSLSSDGRAVAFSTIAPFVREDTNGLFDVYVRSPLR